MRKDIEIPQVKDVYVAAVKEWDEEFLHQNWFVYLVNNSDQRLELTIVISRGNDNEDRKTATLRHGFGNVEPKTFRKIEFLAEEVLSFTNEFLLTYFLDGKLHDRTFVFPPDSISEKNMENIAVLDLEGILAR